MQLIKPNNDSNSTKQFIELHLNLRRIKKKNSIKNIIHSCVTKYFIIFTIQPLLSNSTGNSNSIANSTPNSWKRNKLKKRFD